MSAPPIPVHWNMAEPDRAAVRHLAETLDIPWVAAALLEARGITTAEKGRAFLDPSSPPLTDPYDLTDMDAAVARLVQAKERGEHVRVFGDYDVDGVTGTAILTRALARFGVNNCSYALPSRLTDGYGLNPGKVTQAHDDGVALIVTVDNGIGAHEAADEAKRCGVDLIVTDHHSIEGELPHAVAVINPKRDDPDSAFAHASGAAVSFKLATALTGGTADLDLVALGTVADIVPLLEENRTLVALGLAAMADNPRPGIAALARVARVGIEKVRAENIAFHLGPRINAAGRMGSAMTALELLLTESPEEAMHHAEGLNAANEERRRVESVIYEAVERELDAGFDSGQRTIVLAKRGWHLGVIGIVASKLQSAYCRPVVMIAIDEDGTGHGSARGSSDFDLVEGLGACKHLLVRYGGHRSAAGMTIREEHIEAFREAFEAHAQQAMPAAERVRELPIEALVSFSEIDGQLLGAIDQLEPFGHGNPTPIFCTYGVNVPPESIRELRGGHLRFVARQGPAQFDAVGFNMAGRLRPGKAPPLVDIAFRPRFNTWRGKTTIQLYLEDVRTGESTP